MLNRHFALTVGNVDTSMEQVKKQEILAIFKIPTNNETSAMILIF